MVIAVRQTLAWRYNNAFPRMYAHRVKIFHVTHGHAVIESVTYNFVFHLLPTFEKFLNQDLTTVRKCLGGSFAQFLFIHTDPRSETAESIRNPQHNGVADFLGCLDGVNHRPHCETLGNPYSYLRQCFHKKVTILCFPDSLNGSA